MAKKIKISKKSALKQPDEFISFSARIIQYIKDNESKFLIGSVLIVILILIISFSVYYTRKVNVMGFAQLSKALEEPDVTKRKKLLNDVKNTRFTDAKAYASFFLAQIYKEENNIANAKIELDKAENIKDAYLRGNARIMMVDLLMKEGKLDEALKYSKGIDKDTPKFLKDELLLKEAFIQEKKNNLNEAKQIYKTLETSNPEFYLLKLVQTKSAL
ncbi:MAG: tetratricopeptide repeat protein [Proteobacteria bacterium]|nr:tetratricopeptide repeat protein [Pseudomonadota bacterium]